MPRFRWMVVLVLLILAAGLVVLRSWVIVDETQFVLVTDFGRLVEVYGDAPGEAGFHLKWPWQSTLAIDRRIQVSEPPARETITGDKRNLEVAPYVVWRVADPERFLRSAGTLSNAANRLDERISAALNNAIGTRPLESLASTDPTVWQLDDLSEQVRGSVATSAREELGVDVVDIRLRRFNHPLEVRPAVFDLIRSERRQVAATLRAEGEARYTTMTSQADRERDALLAEADAEAERIRGEGDAEATRMLNAAHGQDPKFYEFLRTLETYKALIDEKAMIVLSSSSPLLRLLSQGPTDDLLGPRPSESPSSEPPPSAAASPVAGSPNPEPKR